MSKTDPCPHCGIFACYEHCYETRDGKHEPDPYSVSWSRSGRDVYVDVNCEYCGQSGCIGKLNIDDAVWS